MDLHTAPRRPLGRFRSSRRLDPAIAAELDVIADRLVPTGEPAPRRRRRR